MTAGLHFYRFVFCTGQAAAQNRVDDQRPSCKAAMGRYLDSIDWPLLFAPLESWEDKWAVLEQIILSGIDILMPAKQMRVCSPDAPWMTRTLKNLIRKRQKAFTTHPANSTVFKYYRNLVNRERKACRGRYYESKIQHLKGEHPKRWWDEVKRLSGAKTKTTDLINVEDFSDLSQEEQANSINLAFLEPLEEYKLTTPLERLPQRIFQRS